jgi:hypothetical protein
MRYCHIPAFPAMPCILFIAPRTTAEFVPTCEASKAKTMRLRSFLLLLVTFILFHGVTVLYGHASGVVLIASDSNGALLELEVDDLTVGNKELNGRDYHVISYDGCAYTSEVGRPRLPVSHVFLGVPPSASISISVVDSQFSNLTGYTPFPVPRNVERASSDGITAVAEEFAMDSEFYRRDVFYPSGNADVIYEGYIRRQRVAVIELRPVQYNPVAKLLRQYSRLVVRVNFSSDAQAILRDCF